MAFPSGTFSDPVAGLAEFCYSGKFSSTSGADWGSGGGTYIVVRCEVLSGSTVLATSYIKNGSDNSKFTLDYPGGNVNWTVRMSEESHNLNGPAAVSVSDTRIGCVLIKR